MASSAARAMWARLLPRVSPTSAPRAYGSQCGAPRPTKAGTRNTPPLSGTLAASVPDSGGVFLVPAFVGLGAPHWDPYARGALVGLTRGSNRAHIARAALEAIAYQSAEVMLAMQKDAEASH